MVGISVISKFYANITFEVSQEGALYLDDAKIIILSRFMVQLIEGNNKTKKSSGLSSMLTII